MALVNEKLNITAVIRSIGPVQEFKNDYKLQKIVVKETREQFAQTFEITFEGSKIEKLKGFEPGQTVDIDIFLKGKEFIKDEKIGAFNMLWGYSIRAK